MLAGFGVGLVSLGVAVVTSTVVLGARVVSRVVSVTLVVPFVACVAPVSVAPVETDGISTQPSGVVIGTQSSGSETFGKFAIL